MTQCEMCLTPKGQPPVAERITVEENARRAAEENATIAFFKKENKIATEEKALFESLVAEEKEMRERLASEENADFAYMVPTGTASAGVPVPGVDRGGSANPKYSEKMCDVNNCGPNIAIRLTDYLSPGDAAATMAGIFKWCKEHPQGNIDMLDIRGLFKNVTLAVNVVFATGDATAKWMYCMSSYRSHMSTLVVKHTGSDACGHFSLHYAALSA
jgi:hypothetical protein